MADITLCNKKDCTKAKSCYRKKAKPSPMWQSYSDFKKTCNEEDHYCHFIQNKTKNQPL